MKEIIKKIGEILSGSINYRFLSSKKSGLPYPYFIGELYKEGGGDESGEGEYRFLLTGFYDGEDHMQLYEAAEKVLLMFPEDTGRLVQCRNGAMLVSTGEVLTDLPTDMDTELTKIQITLKVTRWKGREEWEKGN